MDDIPRRRVSADELRALYNNGGFEEGLRTGRYTAAVRRSGHPSPPAAGEPFCTQSQILEGYDTATGARVALVHRYLRPDGTLGASGRPDPKAVVVDGVLFYAGVSGGGGR